MPTAEGIATLYNPGGGVHQGVDEGGYLDAFGNPIRYPGGAVPMTVAVNRRSPFLGQTGWVNLPGQGIVRARFSDTGSAIKGTNIDIPTRSRSGIYASPYGKVTYGVGPPPFERWQSPDWGSPAGYGQDLPPPPSAPPVNFAPYEGGMYPSNIPIGPQNISPNEGMYPTSIFAPQNVAPDEIVASFPVGTGPQNVAPDESMLPTPISDLNPAPDETMYPTLIPPDQSPPDESQAPVLAQSAPPDESAPFAAPAPPTPAGAGALVPPPPEERGFNWGGLGEPAGFFGVQPQNPIGVFGVGGPTMPAGGGSYFGGRSNPAMWLPGATAGLGAGSAGMLTQPWQNFIGTRSPAFLKWMAMRGIGRHEATRIFAGAGGPPSVSGATQGAQHSGQQIHPT